MGNSVFVTFVGGWGESGPERVLASAQCTVALHNAQAVVDAGIFDKHVIVTNEPEILHITIAALDIERSPDTFHFGRCLKDVLARYDADKACCLGGGSMVLASRTEFRGVAELLSGGTNRVITNNLYSGDMTAFTPVNALDRIPLPEIDNPLPRLLRDHAGLEAVVLEKSITTMLDVDTPTDLAVLSLYPHLPEVLRPAMVATEFQKSRLRAAITCFTNKEARVTVAGRVNSFVWSRLETETACRCRVVSEGRGMRADGVGGGGNSILGYMLDGLGLKGFFNKLAEMGDAAFLDTRVIFGHAGKRFSTADRFYSDMLEPEEISDPWLKEFTHGARDAAIPVVLGGHSLVSGGMLALIDAAWAELGRESN